MVVPIPGSAARVSRLSVVGVGVEALSILEVIALIAGQAGTFGVSCGALIRNGNADLFIIECPSLRASKADLIFPVPVSAAEIGRASSVGR